MQTDVNACRRRMVAAIRSQTLKSFRMSEFAENDTGPAEVVQQAAEQVFYQLCKKVVADGVISPPERKRLRLAANRLELTDEREDEIERHAIAQRVDAAFEDALEDGVISAEEEREIEELKASLGLLEDDDGEFQAVLISASDAARNAEAIGGGDAQSESSDVSTHYWVWCLAVVLISILVYTTRDQFETGNISVGLLFVTFVIPAFTAYAVQRALHRRDIERADRREMVIEVLSMISTTGSSTGSYSSGEYGSTPYDTGRSGPVSYRIDVAGHGSVKVDRWVFRKLRENSRFVVIGSTVHGLKIHRVNRPAIPVRDYSL